MWREEVVRIAKEWQGTPYHHAADLKGIGVDCAMLLVSVYHEAGLIPKIDPRPYPIDWHMHRDEEKFLGWVKQYAVETKDPQPGDIALFRYGRCISHGSIVINWPMIIHAYFPVHAVVLDEVRGVLSKRLNSIWTFRL